MTAMSSGSLTAQKIREAVQRNEAAIVGDEDPAFAGGSYVIVQKYLHDMKGWNALPVETQERIIGRKKLSDIELKDAEKPPFAHNALTSIEENGKEVKILRDNMPFGRPGHGEFGTYFIGYSRTPRITETMLQNMFVGRPAGQLRPPARFQQARYREPVFCAVLNISRQHQLSGVELYGNRDIEGNETPATLPAAYSLMRMAA